MKQIKHVPGMIALLFVILMASGSALHGQTSTGSVNGTITDSNGAAVAGATAKLVNQSTKIETQVTTNQNGLFTFINVNPGMYTLRIESNGFKTLQTAQFEVAVNQ